MVLPATDETSIVRVHNGEPSGSPQPPGVSNRVIRAILRPSPRARIRRRWRRGPAPRGRCRNAGARLVHAGIRRQQVGDVTRPFDREQARAQLLDVRGRQGVRHGGVAAHRDHQRRRHPAVGSGDSANRGGSPHDVHSVSTALAGSPLSRNGAAASSSSRESSSAESVAVRPDSTRERSRRRARTPARCSPRARCPTPCTR